MITLHIYLSAGMPAATARVYDMMVKANQFRACSDIANFSYHQQQNSIRILSVIYLMLRQYADFAIFVFIFVYCKQLLRNA